MCLILSIIVMPVLASIRFHQKFVLMADGVSYARARNPQVAPSGRARDISIVLDITGSMSTNDRLLNAKIAVRQVFEALGAQDRLELVTFAGSSTTVIPKQFKKDVTALAFHRAVDGVSANGGTYF
jgi:Mg-chelatase subunit ChlD